jgi:hypothetical protein
MGNGPVCRLLLARSLLFHLVLLRMDLFLQKMELSCWQMGGQSEILAMLDPIILPKLMLKHSAS